MSDETLGYHGPRARDKREPETPEDAYQALVRLRDEQTKPDLDTLAGRLEDTGFA